MKKFFSEPKSLSLSKIKLANNIALNDDQFQLIRHYCDIFIAIQAIAGDKVIPPTGGVFWNKAKPGAGPFELYQRQNRQEIEHLFLLFNAFRDFCALAYEFDDITPKPDYWIRRYLRLARALPHNWRVQMQPRFGEIGWSINKHPVNRWTSVNQERLSTMMLAGIPHYLNDLPNPRILEMGAGAGELGYALCSALPKATWYDCDLLGSLIYSVIHLSITLPQKKHLVYIGDLALPHTINDRLVIRSPQRAAQSEDAVIYIPHFLLDDFIGHLKLHLAYNTYSFGEMPKAAVSHYATLLADFLHEQGVLFEQNGYFPDRKGDNAESCLSVHFKQYALPQPFDGRWLPNGPIRLWDNNGLALQLQKRVGRLQKYKLIQSLQDYGDHLDIHFPNEKLWEKVYERFAPPQQIAGLFPWSKEYVA